MGKAIFVLFCCGIRRHEEKETQNINVVGKNSGRSARTVCADGPYERSAWMIRADRPRGPSAWSVGAVRAVLRAERLANSKVRLYRSSVKVRFCRCWAFLDDQKTPPLRLTEIPARLVCRARWAPSKRASRWWYRDLCATESDPSFFPQHLCFGSPFLRPCEWHSRIVRQWISPAASATGTGGCCSCCYSLLSSTFYTESQIPIPANLIFT